ncbi:MAG: outer membrane protein transport protein [bacterium]
MSKKNIFLFLCFFILFAYPISADEYHNQQVLVGEKAAGLGGTFVGIGDGAEACYYNPAGLTQLKISYLSVSSQIFEYKAIKGKFLADSKEKLTSLSFVPSFWGMAKDAGEYKFGFSIVVPEYDAYKMHEQYSDLQMGSIIFNNIRVDQVSNDQTYLIGPSIAKILNPRFSLGFTVYFRYLDIANRDTYYYKASDSVSELRAENNSENSGKGLGGMGVVGFLYKPADKINIGLTFKTGSQISNTIDIIERNYTYTASLGSTSGKFNNYYLEKQVSYTSIVPPSFILGLKWEADKKLCFATDITYMFPVGYDKEIYQLNLSLKDYEKKISRVEINEVINLNFGSEYMLDNNVPFRFGFFTDRSTAPKVKDNGTSQPMHIDNYGISVSSGILSQNSSMIFGIKYGWGSGRMTNLDFSSGNIVVDKVKSVNYAFNLSGSYNF